MSIVAVALRPYTVAEFPARPVRPPMRSALRARHPTYEGRCRWGKVLQNGIHAQRERSRPWQAVSIACYWSQRDDGCRICRQTRGRPEGCRGNGELV
jgi:hypothetical protein